MEITTLSSAVALWRALCLDAGLELRLKNGRPGRDADIEVTLRKALAVPNSAISLDAWLAIDSAAPQPKVNVERFLVELLKGQVGFARMMQDILETLVKADARRATHSLSVAFKFEGMDDPVIQTLEEFRESVLRIQKVLQTRRPLPNQHTLWDIYDSLQAVWQTTSNSRPNHFPGVPQTLPTDEPELDKQLTQIGVLVRDIQELWREHGADRCEVIEAARIMSSQTHGSGHLQGQLNAASDFWDCSVINSLQQLPCLVASGKVESQKARDRLAEVVSHLEPDDVWVDRTFRELLDTLAVPAWQRRHELYSVWVGTRLLEVAKAAEPSLRFNPVDGLLSFAFGGSKLATYFREGKEYEIWAELRSALVGSSPKRKGGIQPDFRVVEAGLSPAGDRTVYVLECKHYLRSSKKNFTVAAKDYARSCPSATVHVVNHGPADESKLRAALPTELQSTVRFIGNANCDIEGGAGSLFDAIHAVLFPPSKFPETDEVTAGPGSALPLLASYAGQVFLEWNDSLQDMDLALLVIDQNDSITESINFSRIGSLNSPPFALLDTDVRQGPGIERIDIGAWHFNRYELVATNYSGVGAMTPEALECRVVTPEGTTVLRCPSGLSLSQREWRIAELFVHHGVIKIVPIDPNYQIF